MKIIKKVVLVLLITITVIVIGYIYNIYSNPKKFISTANEENYFKRIKLCEKLLDKKEFNSVLLSLVKDNNDLGVYIDASFFIVEFKRDEFYKDVINNYHRLMKLPEGTKLDVQVKRNYIRIYTLDYLDTIYFKSEILDKITTPIKPKEMQKHC